MAQYEQRELPRELTPGPLFDVVLVLIHTTSSQRRNPQVARTARPRSRPSPAPLPTQRNTKLGSAESAGIGSASNVSQEKEDEKGGSMRITSNFADGTSDESSDWCMCIGGGELSRTAAFFKSSNLRCFGYLSVHQ